MSIIIKGGASSNLADVNSSNFLKVITETSASTNPQNVGALKLFSEVDAGSVIGTPFLLSPETDDDNKLRVSIENLLDTETFNYTSQNTGKHTYLNTTMTVGWSASGLTTNSGNITTTTTGVTFGTYAYFPLNGASELYTEFEAAFTAQPTTNTLVDIGLFLRGASTPYAPTDGVYFRLTSAGMSAVINNNGTETVQLLTFTYVTNQKYQFIISVSDRRVEFFIDGILYYTHITPQAQGQPFMSVSLPFSLRHAIAGGAAGVALSVLLSDYTISTGGQSFNDSFGTVMNRILGSYQGLSGGTMGSLSSYTNSTNPTAAVPSNTALTANLPSGLGGQAWETFTLAVNTDGILMSYQIPSGTANVQGRRLKVTGVKMSAFVQTVLAGGPLNSTFALNYGHTAVSLATAEAATTKARRVVLLPELTQVVTVAQAVNTIISQPGGSISMFSEPIYVNPGEFISLSVKHIGTVGISGTIAYNMQYIYSWE